jgi:hypothetical protein
MIALQAPNVRAQTASSIAPGELLMAWHANTYVPAGFPGKPLPTAQSTVTVTIQAIRNGKLASLSGELIKWYVNDHLVSSGTGLQALRVGIPANPAGSVDVRVELPNATVEPTVKTITIPIVEPQAVIVAPYPNATVPANTTASFRATPFYFNTATARNLLYSWVVNDQAADATENPDQLDLSVGGSGTASISATIQNPLVNGERAQGSMDVRVAQ